MLQKQKLFSKISTGSTCQFLADLGWFRLLGGQAPDCTDVICTVTYCPVAGAMRINSKLYYVLKDHLGSASVVTDATGAVVGEQRYYPFGETRLSTGTMVTDKLFTGQRAMEDLGIYHYGARFYSPKLGRFLSADSIVPGYADPQNLNRYSYVGNSPLNYTDPTGHARIQDGPQQDKFKPSVANKYVPKPKKGNKGGGGGCKNCSENKPDNKPGGDPDDTRNASR